jgi:signal transduction histidine kinase
VAKIKAEAELALRRERDLPYYRDALRSVVHSADQMASTVETLLAAAQERGSLTTGRADVGEVLREVAAGVALLAHEHGIEVRIESSPQATSVGVGADIAEQIIRPIVENACRFARGTIVLGAERKGKEVWFTVADDGPGVSEEEKDKIFEPGVRGSAIQPRPESSRGAGLGLPLARRLARAASGDVELGRSGAGAAFVVRLPSG